MAIRAGADVLGLVAKMPSGPGTISDDLIREICAFAPPSVSTFLLTSEVTAGAIAQHVDYVRPSAVQIVSHISPQESARLRALDLNARIVQVIHVENDHALDLQEAYTDHVDAFLLDSGKPSAAIPELGGTGSTHDWSISRKFVEQSTKPVFLAGGLNADNVAEAIKTVKPFGVDICSKLRTHGKLDQTLLEAFMRAVKESA